jgi:GxxExxY protein
MQLITDKTELNRLSKVTIGCVLAVAGSLGSGFIEKVYENALAHAFRKTGLAVAQQNGVVVGYDGIIVAEYAVELLVQDSVVVEREAVTALNNIHRAQCLNYLEATGLRMCLLLNFGSPRLEIKRLVLCLWATGPIRVHRWQILGANVASKKIEPYMNANGSVPNRPSELSFGIVLARRSSSATHAPKLHA